MKPRPRGHSLVWVGISRGQCECGHDLHVELAEIIGKDDDTVRDMIMDLHSDHLELVRAAR